MRHVPCLTRLAAGLLALALLAACGPAAPSSELAAAPVAPEAPLSQPATSAVKPTRPPQQPAAEPVAAPEKAATKPQPANTPRPAAVEVPEEDPAARRFRSQGWETDFSRRNVSLDEIFSGGVPRDGIPPLDDPAFVPVDEADSWLGAKEPVIYFETGGDARAYPLQIMTWHEIVNDEVGGVPVAVTFCPLCNSAIVFDRRWEGRLYDFGTSGNLRKSDLVMWDRQTESWWQQLTGEAIVGELTGASLDFLPAAIIAWQDFKEFHPQGQVLSKDTGFPRPYGQNPYVGYDQVDLPPFLFRGETDGRLPPKERVAAVSIDGRDVAFPFSVLEQERVVDYNLAGVDLVVFFKPGAQSALDLGFIAESKEVGATGVFSPLAGDRKLTFRDEGGRFLDNENGSVWDLRGQAMAGELAGTQLTPIVHANHFWFAWGAFKPDTEVYTGR